MTIIKKTVKGLLEDFAKDIDIENCNKTLRFHVPGSKSYARPRITVDKDTKSICVDCAERVKVWSHDCGDAGRSIHLDVFDIIDTYPTAEQLADMVKDAIKQCTAIEGEL